MTPAGWLALACAAAALGLVCACVWGSEIVFNPGHKIPLTIFPDQFGLAYENGDFETPDGILVRGWLIPAAEATDRTIILNHGWSDNKGDMLRRFRFLQPRFNLFLFDSRAHGESRARRGTIGYLEAIDFDAAIRFLERTRPRWLRSAGVLGLSMGAAIGLFALARHARLRCGVFESPFRSFTGVVRQFTRNNFPRMPHFPFVWLTLLIIRLRLGDDPEPFSPIHNLARVDDPVLIVTGESDRLMPVAEVRALYDALPGPKELWVVPGAGHGGCQEAAGQEYDRRIQAFFEKHL